MKKKYLFIILFVCIIISLSLSFLVIVPRVQRIYEERKEEERIKNATIIVELNDDLNVSFGDKVLVSSLIKNINGKIINDDYLLSDKLGENVVNFKYINDEGITIPYSYSYKVVDVTAPTIWLGSSYNVTTAYDGDLLEDIMCADDLDDDVKCEIIGEYNTSVVGSYNLTFKATDASNNETVKDFVLNVKKPQNNSNNNYDYSLTDFQYFIDNYKNDNTKIGIDVSAWQGFIDFDKVKEDGVEFAFIRIGGTKGIDKEYFLDNKFINNIEGFNRVGIPVGIYFYSYAKTRESAINDAKWLLEQIKDYKVDLPIVYDWENWSFYNVFHHSFRTMSLNGKAFLDTVNKAGYDGMLYGSKNYLKFWSIEDYPIWVAHYTLNKEVSYQDEYDYWQISDSGRVNGIDGGVDIDIMYMK